MYTEKYFSVFIFVLIITRDFVFISLCVDVKVTFKLILVWVHLVKIFKNKQDTHTQVHLYRCVCVCAYLCTHAWTYAHKQTYRIMNFRLTVAYPWNFTNETLPKKISFCRDVMHHFWRERCVKMIHRHVFYVYAVFFTI